MENNTQKTFYEITLKSIYEKVEEIKKEVQNLKNKTTFLDNQEFIQMMHISKRTAQFWRDKGVIGYSQVGCKIYYKISDIEELLNKNYNPKK